MSYYTDGITVVEDRAFDGGRFLRVGTTHTDKTIQCYVSAALAAWAKPQGGTVRFALPESLDTDVVLLLAVDDADARTDYWADAFGDPDEHGNRILLQIPQLSLAYMPGDVWKVYTGGAGDGQADMLESVQPLFPGGRATGGYGIGYGDAYGFDASGARGYGYNFGRGEYGFDCDMLIWRSEPLAPGAYPVKVVAADRYGNESQAWETTITLQSYARPASGLAVSSYDKATNTLELSFTESEDVN